MADGNVLGSIDLAGGESATAHLHRILTSMCTSFPSVLGGIDVGSSTESFKRAFPELLPRFEAARAASAERCKIATALVDASRSAIVWHVDGGEQPLAEHVTAPAEPFPVESVQLTRTSRLRPAVPFAGAVLQGDALVAEVRSLVERGSASTPVLDGIEWIVRLAGSDGIDLSGRRIVMLGAAAELAPTEIWLEGGADVLWIDVADPPPRLVESGHLSGTLHWVAGGADLLTDPGRIRATIERFAGDDSIDMGLYAYAAGRAREWRLATAMNTIVDALPPRLVRGVAMLVSPTTCGVLTGEDLSGEARRRRDRARWQAVLDRAGALGKGAGHVGEGDTCTNRGIVSIQGSSYQAAQYVGKLMAAEVWATGDRGLHLSANTAGISLTESLHHPVFDTAFSGAGALGVETFDPRTTAHLNGLLTLRDRLDPEAATTAHSGDHGAVNALFATRVHGGIYELPYPIEPALRVATGIGVAKDPRRLLSLLRRS